MTTSLADYRRDYRTDIPLTGGTWQRDGLVMRWVADPKPEPKPRDLIACPTCQARVHESCRNPCGSTRRAHERRIIPRRCACGGAVKNNAQMCPPCAREKRRQTWREFSRKRSRATGDAA